MRLLNRFLALFRFRPTEVRVRYICTRKDKRFYSLTIPRIGTKIVGISDQDCINKRGTEQALLMAHVTDFWEQCGYDINKEIQVIQEE